MKASLPTEFGNGLFSPQGCVLAAIVLSGWTLAAICPQALMAVGIADYGTPYLDSYAVLAALDAVRAGADPHGANPLDPLMRGHVYSDWWLALRWLGLTRAHNFAVGTALAALFGVTVWLTAQLRRWRETTGLALVMLSPPVLLAVKRANNDLMIFVVLAGVGLAATAAVWWRTVVAIGCVALATGLKYFPAPAVLGFMWVRPARRMPAVVLGALVAVGLALASVWSQVDRSRFVVGSGVYTMGAPLIWRDYGWEDKASALLGVMVIAVAALALAVGRVTTGLAAQGHATDRMRAVMGAIVLLACFSAGVNYSYRWIFVIWPGLWLWRRAGDDALSRLDRFVARFACGLILLCLWLDGLLCLAINLSHPLLGPGGIDHLQLIWRLWTQPVPWLLMLLLAGWIAEGALVSVREWWSFRHEG